MREGKIYYDHSQQSAWAVYVLQSAYEDSYVYFTLNPVYPVIILQLAIIKHPAILK
jgi:hypothetical protein